ncbi:hypothetical protein GCM10027592_29590 [Spirosoma flavus]
MYALSPFSFPYTKRYGKKYNSKVFIKKTFQKPTTTTKRLVGSGDGGGSACNKLQAILNAYKDEEQTRAKQEEKESYDKKLKIKNSLFDVLKVAVMPKPDEDKEKK